MALIRRAKPGGIKKKKKKRRGGGYQTLQELRPGVDGISATHWKSMVGLAVEVPTSVAKSLQKEGWEKRPYRQQKDRVAIRTRTSTTEA